MPCVAYGGDIDSIIKQQQHSKVKQAESERNKYTEKEAMQRCRDEVVRVISSKVKELMDKGVNFKKDPGVLLYKNIGGQQYASDGQFNSLIQSSMYDNRLLVVSELGGTNILIQPEGGTKINTDIKFYNDNTWLIKMHGYFGSGYTVNFKSLYDYSEINTKRDEINKNLVKAIEAAIKYGDR